MMILSIVLMGRRDQCPVQARQASHHQSSLQAALCQAPQVNRR